MAETLQLALSWPEALEQHLLRAVLWVDESRVRLPRTLDVGLVWEKGRVRGTVHLPTGRFLVTLRVKPLTDRAWKWALEHLVQRPAASQALLAGRLDPVVIELFEEAGASLFARGTRRVECTCKGERDCRHRLALVARMVAEVTENPFLWFSLLGREREEFLATLRVALMAELPADEAGALDRGRFWAVPGVLAAEASAGAGEPAPTLVEQLGPFPLLDGPLLVAGRPGLTNYRSLTEFLQHYANQVTRAARALQSPENVNLSSVIDRISLSHQSKRL